jgi:hypothetical protein
MSSKSKLPVCWLKNGPLPVDKLTDSPGEATCDDCTALQQAFQEVEDAAADVLFDQARINEILGEL